jgi:hypothetical protein
LQSLWRLQQSFQLRQALMRQALMRQELLRQPLVFGLSQPETLTWQALLLWLNLFS